VSAIEPALRAGWSVVEDLSARTAFGLPVLRLADRRRCASEPGTARSLNLY
jgi:hypothetical protein